MYTLKVIALPECCGIEHEQYLYSRIQELVKEH